MLHMQSPYVPASGTNGGGYDWSGEISGQMPQGGQITTSQTTTQQNANGQTTTSQITTHQSTPSQTTSGQGASNGQSAGGQNGAGQSVPSGQMPADPGTGGTNGAGNQTMQLTGNQNGSIPPQRIDPVVRPAPTSSVLDLRHNLSQDVIESPTTLSEAQLGSMKAVLGRNLGNFVVATFLVGTQGTTSWEGVLFDVGNDYLIIYQTGRDRYVVCDIYSLKYIEFYDTRRQEMCENLIRQQGWQNNGWQTNN